MAKLNLYILKNRIKKGIKEENFFFYFFIKILINNQNYKFTFANKNGIIHLIKKI